MTSQRRSFALYVKQHDGTSLRMTCRANGTSVRDVTASILKRLPHLNPADCQIAHIARGGYEGPKVPLEPRSHDTTKNK